MRGGRVFTPFRGPDDEDLQVSTIANTCNGKHILLRLSMSKKNIPGTVIECYGDKSTAPETMFIVVQPDNGASIETVKISGPGRVDSSRLSWPAKQQTFVERSKFGPFCERYADELPPLTKIDEHAGNPIIVAPNGAKMIGSKAFSEALGGKTVALFPSMFSTGSTAPLWSTGDIYFYSTVNVTTNEYNPPSEGFIIVATCLSVTTAKKKSAGGNVPLLDKSSMAFLSVKLKWTKTGVVLAEGGPASNTRIAKTVDKVSLCVHPHDVKRIRFLSKAPEDMAKVLGRAVMVDVDKMLAKLTMFSYIREKGNMLRENPGVQFCARPAPRNMVRYSVASAFDAFSSHTCRAPPRSHDPRTAQLR